MKGKGDPSFRRGVRAFLGLGSNVGDRIGHLRFAVERLRRQSDVHVEALSPVYETEAHPRGGEGPAYLNAVVQVASRLGPRDLLAIGLDIERARGRERTSEERWAPRTLDVDLLIFGQVSLREPGLVVPHPRLAERRFVLRPLADVAPDVHVPAPFNATPRDLLASCEDQGLIRRTSHGLDVPDDDPTET